MPDQSLSNEVEMAAIGVRESAARLDQAFDLLADRVAVRAERVRRARRVAARVALLVAAVQRGRKAYLLVSQTRQRVAAFRELRHPKKSKSRLQRFEAGIRANLLPLTVLTAAGLTAYLILRPRQRSEQPHLRVTRMLPFEAA